MKKVISLVMILALGQVAWATTWNVEPYGTGETSLWTAIEQAQSGDEIVLADGLYGRDSSSRTYIGSKDLTIRSLNGSQSCLIDLEQSDFLYIYGNGSNACTFEGLTLMNAEGSYGSVFEADYIQLNLIDCVVRDCGGAYYGGVIYGYNSEINLDRCQFLSNSTLYEGGVIYGDYLDITASDCVFADNYAGEEGGVVYYYDSDVTFLNCTFHNNGSDSRGAIMAGYYGQPTLTNCIISDSSTYAIYAYQSSASEHLYINNCLIYGNSSPFYYHYRSGDTYSTASALNGLSGCSGNLSGQPGFALDADYHLTAASAAIDQGRTSVASNADLDGYTRVIDGNGDTAAIVDIGAYEYDPEASCLVISPTVLKFVRDHNSPNPESQTLTLSNSGNLGTTWQALTTEDWLSVDPNAGTDTPVSLTVSVATDGMDRGVYFGQIQLIDPNAVNSPRMVTVALQIRGKLQVPETYSSIQAAVNEALDGEIIEVQAGTYYETVSIDKSLDLIGIGEPNIWGVYVNADDCNVAGFHCESSSSGVIVYGSRVTIANMAISGASSGLRLSSSVETRVTNVTISDCSSQGLSLSSCESCYLRDVNIVDCERGFTVNGSDPNDYHHDIDLSNTVDGKPVYYLVGEIDRVIASSMADPACLYLVDCEDVVAFRLSLAGNGKGICMVNSSRCTLRMVTLSDCDHGISMESCTDNALISNTVTDCEEGIVLSDCSDIRMQSNICQDNQSNFTCEAWDLSTYYTHQIDTTNTVDGKPLYYLVSDDNEDLDGTVTPMGCLYAIDCRKLTVENQELCNNGYGAVLIDCDEVTMESISVHHNSYSGLLIEECSDVDVVEAEVTLNDIGIELEYNEEVEIERSRISSNDTGVRAYYSEYTLLGSMIHNNEGGGVYHYTYDSDMAGTISFCTIFNNQVPNYSYEDYGGGITGGVNYLSIENSIIWGNSPGQIADISWDEYDVSHSLVGGTQTLTGQGNLNLDPGLTSTGHLTLGSPCINTGHSDGGRRRLRDIDGESRNLGGLIDMGADEYLDDDLDGLPNWLEYKVDANGLALDPNDDLDEDGYTNLEEYLYFGGAILTPVATYYVDPLNGDDREDGLTVDTAKQSAAVVLNSMTTGERLILMPGTYNETLSVAGKAIVIQGMDPLDPNVTAATVLTQTLTLTGCTGIEIRGLTFSSQGRTYGLYCSSGSPKITHCRFTDNVSWSTFYSSGSDLTFSYCLFARNAGIAGGCYFGSSNVTMDHCLMVENQENTYARALVLESSQVSLTNCTLTANESNSMDVELTAYYGLTTVPSILMYNGDLDMSNTILWEGDAAIVDLQETSTAAIRYSVLSEAVDESWLGEGNLWTDPLFAGDGDYHLQSQGGRWDAVQNQWVADDVTSPCIDAGDPDSPLDQESGSRINMGAYGGTAEASQ